MSRLRYYRHGDYVRPDYADGAWGRSVDAERPDGQVSGIVQRFRKGEEAAWNPQALGWIKATYGDAIEYTGMTTALMGLPFFGGVLAGAVGIVGASVAGYWVFRTQEIDNWVRFFGLFAILPIGLIFLALGLYGLLMAWHETIGQPEDRPVIFDRKRRKVYRIQREEHRGFRGVFRRWPVLACEYDWDLCDAEHQADLYTTGGTIARNHALMFAVRRSADDPTIIDSFEIGNSYSLGEDLVPNMWEHIRRFMEANGPHLPTPDEPLANREPVQSWWQAMGDVGWFGPNYFKWWRDLPGVTAIGHLISPVAIPMYLLRGTGNYLSRKTAKRYDWPEEVKTAVGPRRLPKKTA